MMPETHGLILHLQRLSTEDGPGIRTTVFFKGCPLNCAWCHNPESIDHRPQVHWLENRCIGCRTCLGACQEHCLEHTPDGLVIDRQRCSGCGECAQACPANAVELLGQRTTVAWLMTELLKDRAFFEKSQGGVTLSGGEPALQAAFAEDLLRRLKDAGIHTALDTCGLCAPQVLDRLYPWVDLFLFDLKLLDPVQHRLYTGQDNRLILSNLVHIASRLNAEQPGKNLWIRTPLIPGATFTQPNLAAAGAFIASQLDGLVQRWELCAFNNLCRDKYRRLDLEWSYQEIPLLTQADLDRAGEWARASGVDPRIVFVTGAARVEPLPG